MALQLYLEGLSLRGIEGLLKISHVTVLEWVRQWGKTIAKPENVGGNSKMTVLH
jgi:transposase-like protein